MNKPQKIFLLLVLPSYFTLFPVKADVPETLSFSPFSLFNIDTSFQDALEDPELAPLPVVSFYGKMKNEPVWLSKGRLTKYGEIAIDVLKNADQEGLNPQDYQDAIPPTKLFEDWAKAEILLTKRFLEFISHLRAGRIDPMTLSPDIKFHSPRTDPVDLLVRALQDTSTNGEKLRHMAPSLSQYIDLKKILAEYRQQTQEGDIWPPLATTQTLRLGDIYPDVQKLRQILVRHGDLPIDKVKGEKFDAAVDAALRQFQKRYSLEPDGAVGHKTREALNYPIQERINQIIINMERLRWLPDELGDKHIIINVAGYVLHGFENSIPTLTMPIIVGRPDRPTPLFYTNLKNIVINPSWGVPYSIFITDKLPKIRQNPRYVQQSHFIITDHRGRIIDPEAADWANEGNNYYLRQSPGAHNALGRIKFNIENPYTIYLHGTPEQHLFTKKARAFSSGCIRLKYPTKLAAWALNNHLGWSPNHIESAIGLGNTQVVPLGEYIPVYFTYQTIWVKDSKKGKYISFSNDPYKLDEKMMKSLGI